MTGPLPPNVADVVAASVAASVEAATAARQSTATGGGDAARTGTPLTQLGDDAWQSRAAARHLPTRCTRDLPAGAAFVRTPELDRLVEFVRSAVEDNLAVMVSGDTGAGKTMLAGAVQGVADAHVVNVVMPSGAKQKEPWVHIATAVTGAARGTKTDLQNQVAEALLARSTLLILDDTHNVSLDTLMALRWLTERTNRGFGMLVVGIGLDKYFRKKPELDRRIARRVLLKQRPFTAMLPLLRQFHPILDAADDEVLAALDKAYGRRYGWGAWAHLVGAAIDCGADEDGLTAEIAEYALLACTGEQIKLGAGRVR